MWKIKHGSFKFSSKLDPRWNHEGAAFAIPGGGAWSSDIINALWRKQLALGRSVPIPKDLKIDCESRFRGAVGLSDIFIQGR